MTPGPVARGRLVIVRDGGTIRVAVGARRVELLVEDTEVQARLAACSAPGRSRRSVDQGLCVEGVLQAAQDADLHFLPGYGGAHVPRESHR